MGARDRPEQAADELPARPRRGAGPPPARVPGGGARRGDLDRIEEVARSDAGRLIALIEKLPEDERVAVRSRVLDERPYRRSPASQVLGDGHPQAGQPRAGADARSVEGDGIDVNDYLDRVEAQLTELTEKGAHQRLRARRGGIGAAPARGAWRPRRPRGPAATVRGVRIPRGGCGGGGRRRDRARQRPQLRQATRRLQQRGGRRAVEDLEQPPPTDPAATYHRLHHDHLGLGYHASGAGQFNPQSFTAISELTWWVLGLTQCPASSTVHGGPCGKIMLTTDGGQHFTSVNAPNAAFSGQPSQPGYSQLRFADSENGFAFGPNLYADARRRTGLETGERRRLRQRPRDLRRRGVRDRERVGQRRRRRSADALARERGRLDRARGGRRCVRRAVGPGLECAGSSPASATGSARTCWSPTTAVRASRATRRRAPASGASTRSPSRRSCGRTAPPGPRAACGARPTTARTSRPPSPAARSASRTRRRSRQPPPTRRWSDTSSSTGPRMTG